MNRLDRERLEDMLQHAETAVRLLGSADPAGLAADDRTYLAVRKAIEIVGEAANQVSEECRATLPEISWFDAIAMRHRLVHGYRTIHPVVVVGTVRDDFPPLIAALERALKDEPA